MYSYNYTRWLEIKYPTGQYANYHHNRSRLISKVLETAWGGLHEERISYLHSILRATQLSEDEGVRTLRHRCRSVQRTFRHWCRNILVPKCPGAEVSVNLWTQVSISTSIYLGLYIVFIRLSSPHWHLTKHRKSLAIACI